eukprot:jgi/Hompol1/1638/HPOL_005670-RA
MFGPRKSRIEGKAIAAFHGKEFKPNKPEPLASGKLRIAFVHPDLGIGGAERLVVDAAVGLQERGYEVTVFTSHHDPAHSFVETRDGTLDVVVLGDWIPRGIYGKGHALFAILRSIYLSIGILLLARNRFDVIFVDQLSAPIPLLRYCDSKVLNPTYMLLTKRETLLKRLYRIPIDYIEEMTTKMADAIAVNSDYTASIFRASFKSIDTVPETLYPGIHLNSYDTDPDLSDATVKQLVSTKKTVLSINRFERKKDIGLAIKAFAKLKVLAPKQFPEMRLVIAGGYDKRVKENVEHHRELEQIAKDFELSVHTIDCYASNTPDETTTDTEAKHAQVVFVLSFNEAQRAYLLSSSLCLVYTPRNEHFGIVPVEAMYAQLPVIAVNSGGPKESIVPGKTGYLCDPDADAFAEKIAAIVQGGDGRKSEMGRLGRKRVQEHFSLNAFVDRLEVLLQQALRGDNLEAQMVHQVFMLLLSGIPICFALLILTVYKPLPTGPSVAAARA